MSTTTGFMVKTETSCERRRTGHLINDYYVVGTVSFQGSLTVPQGMTVELHDLVGVCFQSTDLTD